jgi:hypothetical protein
VRALRRPAAFALLAATVLLSSAPPALACPSCFGDAQGPLIDAARLGVWLLLAVTLGLQGAFAAFFLYLRRRAASAAGQPPHDTLVPPAPGRGPQPEECLGP